MVKVLFAVVMCVAAVRAEVMQLDGTWQAEVAPEAQGDAIPAAFTRTIPVPGHWPLMKPAATDVLCGGKQNRPERALAYGRGP